VFANGVLKTILTYLSEDVYHYSHSEFMGHAMAEDTISAFETATSDLHLSDLIQISIDTRQG